VTRDSSIAQLTDRAITCRMGDGGVLVLLIREFYRQNTAMVRQILKINFCLIIFLFQNSNYKLKNSKYLFRI
jgi:uncharacterized membrane protein YczE